MVRNQVCFVCMNYHTVTFHWFAVGDEAVNKFVASNQHADYFLHLVKFFRGQCISFSVMVSNASKNLGVESSSSLLSAIDEIEDNLYYFSDVISAGIPEVGRLIMDGILTLLIFPLILPSLRTGVVNETGLGAVTSLYLLCCILRIVKIKDLANTVASALLCHIETFSLRSELKLNGHVSDHGSSDASQNADENNVGPDSYSESLQVTIPLSSSSQSPTADNNLPQQFTPREALLSFVTCGDDVQVSGSLSLLATLLQTKG
ncbi:hypothetical protein Fot_07736 [Forsythia ovata]|uniref:Uncharacterized protein n=1 Tax=Forsythia ovata TaxID=205694 RepID=A0ABD1WX37_9LAMI